MTSKTPMPPPTKATAPAEPFTYRDMQVALARLALTPDALEPRDMAVLEAISPKLAETGRQARAAALQRTRRG